MFSIQKWKDWYYGKSTTTLNDVKKEEPLNDVKEEIKEQIKEEVTLKEEVKEEVILKEEPNLNNKKKKKKK